MEEGCLPSPDRDSEDATEGLCCGEGLPSGESGPPSRSLITARVAIIGNRSLAGLS